MDSDYKALVAKLEELSRLGGILSVLHWDQEVVMPSGGADIRARQMAVLAGVLHDKMTDAELGGLLQNLVEKGESRFTAEEWCNIREAKRDYDRETRVPKSLVQEVSQLSSSGHEVWVKARKETRFQDFAPVLKRMVELKKQWAACIDPRLPPYDVNIDVFERGANMAFLDPIFDKLRDALKDLIRNIQGSSYHPRSDFLKGKFSVARQEEIGRRISRDLGFDFDKGRMDTSVHPFCGGGHATDVRFTTRYREDDFIESLFAVIHETGHALYEQGRPVHKGDLPCGEAMTMGIHESQSLFWERMIAQSFPFCAYYLPVFRDVFPEALRDVSPELLYEAVNICAPSFIRVEADEVTYPMHIILRYELEKGLFSGALAVDELPDVWNGKMQEYLGVRPPNDALGVLQDTHWSGGSFGYFPSYSLGAIYACQFYRKLCSGMPDVESHIARGEFAPVKNWLAVNIHSAGRLYSTDDLVRRVTGEVLNVDHYIEYLRKKYKAIYRLN